MFTCFPWPIGLQLVHEVPNSSSWGWLPPSSCTAACTVAASGSRRPLPDRPPPPHQRQNACLDLHPRPPPSKHRTRRLQTGDRGLALLTALADQGAGLVVDLGGQRQTGTDRRARVLEILHHPGRRMRAHPVRLRPNSGVQDGRRPYGRAAEHGDRPGEQLPVRTDRGRPRPSPPQCLALKMVAVGQPLSSRPGPVQPVGNARASSTSQGTPKEPSTLHAVERCTRHETSLERSPAPSHRASSTRQASPLMPPSGGADCHHDVARP